MYAQIMFTLSYSLVIFFLRLLFFDTPFTLSRSI
jgi:hypothetical protein